MNFDAGFSQVMRELRETYRMGGIGIVEWREAMRAAGMPLQPDTEIFVPPRPLPERDDPAENDIWAPAEIDATDPELPGGPLAAVPDLTLPDIYEEDDDV